MAWQFSCPGLICNASSPSKCCPVPPSATHAAGSWWCGDAQTRAPDADSCARRCPALGSMSLSHRVPLSSICRLGSMSLSHRVPLPSIRRLGSMSLSHRVPLSSIRRLDSVSPVRVCVSTCLLLLLGTCPVSHPAFLPCALHSSVKSAHHQAKRGLLLTQS